VALPSYVAIEGFAHGGMPGGRARAAAGVSGDDLSQLQEALSTIDSSRSPQFSERRVHGAKITPLLLRLVEGL